MHVQELNAVVPFSALGPAFNKQLQRHSDRNTMFRVVTDEEFAIFRDNCIGVGKRPDYLVSLAEFSQFWLRWLGPVFNLLVRIKDLWCQWPRLVYIVNKVRPLKLSWWPLVAVDSGPNPPHSYQS